MEWTDYRLLLAQAQAAIPSYGEPERLQLQRDASLRADDQEIRRQKQEKRMEEDLILKKRAADRMDLQATPATAFAAYNHNIDVIGAHWKALELLDNNESAFGLQNELPDKLIERLESGTGGVEARKAITNILLSDRVDATGKASNLYEQKDIEKGSVITTNTPKSIRAKLLQSIETLGRENNNMVQTYTADKFKVPITPRYVEPPERYKRKQSNSPDGQRSAQPAKKLTLEELRAKYYGVQQ